jgi:hypothetical protein
MHQKYVFFSDISKKMAFITKGRVQRVSRFVCHHNIKNDPPAVLMGCKTGTVSVKVQTIFEISKYFFGLFTKGVLSLSNLQ